MKPKHVPTFVYIAKAEGWPELKIGAAVDPVRRARRLPYEHPGSGAVTLLWAREYGDVAMDIERRAHIALKARCDGREWFRATLQECIWAVMRSARPGYQWRAFRPSLPLVSQIDAMLDREEARRRPKLHQSP